MSRRGVRRRSKVLSFNRRNVQAPLFVAPNDLAVGSDVEASGVTSFGVNPVELGQLNRVDNVNVAPDQPQPGVYPAWPVDPGGVLANDIGITNPNAVWYPINVAPLDGQFTFGNGGYLNYTRGTQRGLAMCGYVCLDADGLGTTILGRVRVNVEGDPTESPTHYVSPTGTGVGTIGDPMSLADANTDAAPGRVYSLRGGNYTGQIRPSASGTSGNRIVYQNYPGETPVIIGTGVGNKTAIRLDESGQSYITVDGVDVDGQNHPGSVTTWDETKCVAAGSTISTWVRIDGGNYNIIRNCDFIRCNGYSGISVGDSLDSYYNIFEDCTMYINGTPYFEQRCDLFEFKDHARYNILRRCDLRYGGHAMCNLYGGINVIEDCTWDNRKWDSYVSGVRTAGTGVTEFNLDDPNAAGSRIGSFHHNYYDSNPKGYCLWQRNAVLGNDLTGPGQPQYIQGRSDGFNTTGEGSISRLSTYDQVNTAAIGVKCLGDAPEVRYSREYNNIVAGWNRLDGPSDWDGVMMFNANSSADCRIEYCANINNAYAPPLNPSDAEIKYRIGSSKFITDQYDNNLVQHNSFQQSSINVFREGTTPNIVTLASLQDPATGRPDIFTGNTFDEHIAEDGGRELTTITSATGTGQTFTVSDPYYFFPGISQLGYPGDVIRINRTGDAATITAINYATGQITVDSPVSWVQGQGVALDVMVKNGKIPTGIYEPSASVQGISWTPGHYMIVKNLDSQEADQATRFGYYDDIAAETAIKGVCIYVKWAELEPTEGVFNFDWITNEINYLQGLTVPKKLWVRFDDQVSLGATGAAQWFPTWAWNANYIGTTSTVYAVARWNAAARAAYSALHAAFAAQFDSNPGLEGVSLNKESAAGNSGDQGWTAQGSLDGIVAYAVAAKPLFTQTNVVSNFNATPTGLPTSAVGAAMQACVDVGVGLGGPDLAPECDGDGITGPFYDPPLQKPQSYNWLQPNVYRGQVPIALSVETSELGNAAVSEFSGYPWARLYDYGVNYIGCSHIFWARRDFTQANGSYQHLWTAAMGSADDYILPNIQANPVFPTANVQYPTAYSS